MKRFYFTETKCFDIIKMIHFDIKTKRDTENDAFWLFPFKIWWRCNLWWKMVLSLFFDQLKPWAMFVKLIFIKLIADIVLDTPQDEKRLLPSAEEQGLTHLNKSDTPGINRCRGRFYLKMSLLWCMGKYFQWCGPPGNSEFGEREKKGHTPIIFSLIIHTFAN